MDSPTETHRENKTLTRLPGVILQLKESRQGVKETVSQSRPSFSHAHTLCPLCEVAA